MSLHMVDMNIHFKVLKRVLGYYVLCPSLEVMFQNSDNHYQTCYTCRSQSWQYGHLLTTRATLLRKEQRQQVCLLAPTFPPSLSSLFLTVLCGPLLWLVLKNHFLFVHLLSVECPSVVCSDIWCYLSVCMWIHMYLKVIFSWLWRNDLFMYSYV